MIIPLAEVFKKYDLTIKGIIHVGAHFAQEHETYNLCGIQRVVYIEPCKAAFRVLQNKFSDNLHVKLFNYACGEKNTRMKMYVETFNKGMSNSLLKPLKHLIQFPSIRFRSREKVDVKRLDELPFPRNNYNMMAIDVQGAELMVLKGASETLKTIDIISTEVNTDELYRGCAKMDEIDNLLHEFDRVETNLVGGNWGDAIYLRRNTYSRPSPNELQAERKSLYENLLKIST
jgi:FkbM family methyltransferase